VNAEHLIRQISRYASFIPMLADGVAALPAILMVVGIVLCLGIFLILLFLFLIHAMLGDAGTVLFFLALCVGAGFIVYGWYLMQQRARFINKLLPSLNDYRLLLARYDLNDLPDGDFKDTLQVHADHLARLLRADAPFSIFNDLHIDPSDTRAVLFHLPVCFEHFNYFTLEHIKQIFPVPIDATDNATRLHQSICDELTRRGDTIIGVQYVTTPELQHTRPDAVNGSTPTRAKPTEPDDFVECC
jgi:hypothetical protein